MIDRLPESTHLIYSELLDALIHSAVSSRGISFHTKQVSGSKYWYMEYVIGSDRHTYYLGPDLEELQGRIESVKQAWIEEAPDSERRSRLVAMFVAGGGSAISGSHSRVLEALSQSGVFLVGGVLVGSHAFALMGNVLGVRWPRAILRTQDIDIAQDPKIHVGIPRVAARLQATLESVDERFFAVPALDRKSTSTSFKIRGADLSVSLLTPLLGKPNSSPIAIPSLDAMAEPMRFLEYLMEDVQMAAIPTRQGILVNIPSPARFALHKLVVSQRRPAAFTEKRRKDLSQAEAVLEVLLEDRPGEIYIAADAARKMPIKFHRQLQEGASQLTSEALREQLEEIIA